jgi:putative transposase
MDWHSRRMRKRRLSNSMDASLCVEALKEGLAKYEPPEIFNTDSQKMIVSSRAV